LKSAQQLSPVFQAEKKAHLKAFPMINY
jgi:hypothetical protein